MKVYRDLGKRLLDIAFAVLILIVSSPLWLISIVLLMVINNGKPFFFQKRPGKQEKIFNLIKFRTMNDLRDENGELLPDEFRLTKVGSIVRKLSLDEVPQLVNVLKGDMSIIGPRPLLIRYLPYYTDEERIRHSIRPGITGLAQISGRNNLPWDVRLKKDIEYVQNLSFRLDLKIFLSTIKKVFFREDIVLAPSTQLIDFDDFRKQN